MSELKNINFEPHSDIAVSNEETITSHTNYIKQNLYKEAMTVVNNNNGMNGKGLRASFFNVINEKIRDLQIYLLNKKAAPYEYYSIEEPDQAWMSEQGYKFWIKPIE